MSLLCWTVFTLKKKLLLKCYIEVKSVSGSFHLLNLDLPFGRSMKYCFSSMTQVFKDSCHIPSKAPFSPCWIFLVAHVKVFPGLLECQSFPTGVPSQYSVKKKNKENASEVKCIWRVYLLDHPLGDSECISEYES